MARLDRTVADNAAGHDAKLDDQHAHFSDAIAKLNQRWLEEWTSFDSKTATALADGATRVEALAAAVQNHHEHFSGLCSRADRKFADRCSADDESTAAHRQSVADTISQMASSFSTEVHAVATQGSEAAREAAQKHDALSRVVNEQHEHFTRVCTELDRKYSDSTASLDRRAVHAGDQLKALATKIQSNAGVRAVDLDQELATLDSLAGRARR